MAVVTPPCVALGPKVSALSELDSLSFPAPTWSIVVCECPWWTIPPHEAYAARPSVTLLFAHGDVQEGSGSRLLRHAHYYGFKESTELVAAAASDLVLPLEHVPPGALPRSIRVCYQRARVGPVGAAATNEAALDFAGRIVTVARGSMHASDRQELDSIAVEAADSSELDSAAAANTAAALAWVQDSVTAVADASKPVWATSAQRLASLECASRVTVTSERALTVATGNAEYPSAVLIPARLVSHFEDLAGDHGEPLKGVQPSRIVSVRLHRDVGDSLLLCDALAQPANPTARYRDLLHHEDGELVVSLAVADGMTAMVDLTALSEHGRPALRTYRNVLCGSASRPSPLHATQLDAVSLALTDDEFGAVATIVALLADTSSVDDLPAARLDAGAAKCKWCDRVRNNNKRCGACKSVAYCCAHHQQLDWKDGGHRKQCKVLKAEAEAVRAALDGVDTEALPPAPESDARVLCDLARRAVAGRDGAQRVDGVWAHPAGTNTADGMHTLCAALRSSEAFRWLRRLLVAVPDVGAAGDTVVSIRESGTCEPPRSGLLGDSWRDKGGPEAAIGEEELRVMFVPSKLNHISSDRAALLDELSPACGFFSAGGDQSLSFFDAFPRTLLELHASHGALILFGFEARHLAATAVGVLHQLAASAGSDASTLSLPNDGSDVKAVPGLAGLSHGPPSQLQFANLFQFTVGC